jgi:hypothetical protein
MEIRIECRTATFSIFLIGSILFHQKLNSLLCNLSYKTHPRFPTILASSPPPQEVPNFVETSFSTSRVDLKKILNMISMPFLNVKLKKHTIRDELKEILKVFL